MRVRIKVIKVMFDPQLADRYLTKGSAVGPCPLLEEGQEFMFEGQAVMPRGLCPWAWIDIYKGVGALAAGGGHAPWNNHPAQTIVCCTDGIRPVVFELTAVE